MEIYKDISNADIKSITISGVEFTPKPDIKYKHDYIWLVKVIHTPELWHTVIKDPAELNKPNVNQNFISKLIFRDLVLNDLWFMLHFILEVPDKLTNTVFATVFCREVEDDGDNPSLNLCSRGHLKSSIRKARNIQRALKYPKRCQMIVSHTRPTAKKHLIPIMNILENNEFLKSLFPDRLYKNPRNESPKWNEDEGIILKGHDASRTENSLEAWGIKDGMPIGVHFEYIDIDDLETKDDVLNPDIVKKGREAVDLCVFLLTDPTKNTISFWGTPYSHEGIYIPYVLDKKNADGTSKYKYRRKPGTVDGTLEGKPVLWDEKSFRNLVSELMKEGGVYAANCQILINPTPIGRLSLNPEFLKEVKPDEIPRNVVKFMGVDWAGDNKGDRDGSSWAIVVIGVDPQQNDIGVGNIYLLDAVVAPMSTPQAVEEFMRIYLRNGIIHQVGIEKSSGDAIKHFAVEMLRQRGRRISEEDGSLVDLKPGGRAKDERIQSALGWILNNGRLYMSTAVANVYREECRMEMSKFPFGKKDMIDIMSYICGDMLKDADLTRYQNVLQMRFVPNKYVLATAVG